MDINEPMINEEIRDREVRVVATDGTQLGVMSTQAALQLAEQQNLDLVKIVPGAQPPVCKLMDYDKHRYEQSKRERELARTSASSPSRKCSCLPPSRKTTFRPSSKTP